MLFNSYIFQFLFLPLCLGGFYLFAHWGKAVPAKLWLTGFSFWFYGYFNPSYLLIMIFSILFNYICFRLINITRIQVEKFRGVIGRGRASEAQLAVNRLSVNRLSGGQPEGTHIPGKFTPRPNWSRIMMAAGVICNLGILFYFKYFDFFIESVNAVFGTSFLLKGILLPLGISFFTFQQIGFLVDTYRGEIRECNFLDYALFVSFFPQLIAGPIVNHNEMMPQFGKIGEQKLDWNRFAGGVFLFTLGMVKKVLVADTFGKAVSWGYQNILTLNSIDSLLLMLFYTIQLYFDFSGYCNMAMGLAELFGIKLPINFNSPYKAIDIEDFWKRWHMTLNRFFTKYLYIPLGGNRKGKWKMCRNLLLVFVFSGIWHGAGWTFIIWGALHGVVYVLTRLWILHQQRGEKIKQRSRINKFIGTICTFAFINITWVFFRSETVGQALEIFRHLFTGGIALPAEAMMQSFNLDEFWYVIKLLHLDSLPYSQMYLGGIITAVTMAVVFFAPNADEVAVRFRPKAWNALVTAGLFLWCVLSLSGVSSFLYFNF